MKNNPGYEFFPALCLMCGVLLTHGTAGAQNSTEWTMHKTPDGAHPSGAEQKMMWLMNRARVNPAAEGNFLATTGDRTTEFAIMTYGVDLTRMRAEFAAIAPAAPAAFDLRLYDASRQHAEAMISLGAQTHDGQFERVEASGFNFSALSLSVFAYCENPLYGHASLNIDIGGPPAEGGMQEGRGHRQAIMSSEPEFPPLSSVGLALIPESNPASDIGPLVFSGAYAAAIPGASGVFNRFLVGTVWTDKNQNGLYDEGEGLEGVKVQPDHGPWHAVTGLAGGYAIPAVSSGTYRMTFSGGRAPAAYLRDVTVGEVSVLADVETLSSVPVVLPFVASLVRDSTGNLILSWSGGTPPYQVQTTGNLESAWRNLGDPTRELLMTVPAQGLSGFFRVVSSQ